MKKKEKVFRWITKAVALVLSCVFSVSALSSCKTNESPENTLYNEMAGFPLPFRQPLYWA